MDWGDLGQAAIIAGQGVIWATVIRQINRKRVEIATTEGQHEGVGIAPARRLPDAAYLPFADLHGPVVVGSDQSKAFPARVVLADAELCAETSHLISWGSRTCVRCYQDVFE